MFEYLFFILLYLELWKPRTFFLMNIKELFWRQTKIAICVPTSLGLDRAPRSLQDFLDLWLPFGCANYNLKLVLLTTVLWGLWTTRNKRAIEGKFPRAPSDILFKINAFLQWWKVRLRNEDQHNLQILEGQVRCWMEFLLKLNSRPPDEAFM